jgi:Domain of unknown function (DUF4270)
MKNIFIASVCLIGLLIVGACNKSSQLGADLFDSSKLDLKFSDSLITITAQTENPDSVVAINSSTSLSLLPLGKMYDPVFGVTDARIFANFTYGASVITLDGATTYVLDDVKAVLAYNAPDTYGDTMAQQKIGIYRLDASESLANASSTIYTNKKFKSQTTPLGSLTFTPKPYSRIYVNDSTTLRPHISIKLDTTFGKALLDTAVYSVHTTNKGDVGKYFRGFEIRSDQTTSALLSFNLADDSSGIYLYYHKLGDTVKLSYRFPFATASYPYFNHNYAAGTINQFFNGKKTASGDSLMFVQGMAGANVKFEFPNLKQRLGTAAVNRAELEFTILEDSTDKYLPIERFILTTATGAPVNDLLRNSTSVLAEYGGTIVTEAGNIRRYKCNISQHLQDMLYGRAGTVLYLLPDNGRGTIPNKQGTTRRVVLYGTKHSKYPAKLNLYYTKP